jgi:predicted Zn-dependent protease
MQLDEAAAILDQLTARRPDDYELLVEACQVARQVPANAAYHRIAARVLALDAGNRAVLEMVAETFREYLQTARPRPHLTVTRAVALAETFAAADMLPESERLGEMIAKQKELRPEMAAALVAIGAALVKAGQRERARRWLDLVKSSLPGSPHADRAQALLMRP